MRWQAATAPMSRLWARTLHHLDRLVFRLTKERHTFSTLASGLPVVMLTTTGAKSGKQRTSPVLGIPDGERIALVASNWGQHRHPGWYHNLRANPRASISVGGVTRRAGLRSARGGAGAAVAARLGSVPWPGWLRATRIEPAHPGHGAHAPWRTAERGSTHHVAVRHPANFLEPR